MSYFILSSRLFIAFFLLLFVQLNLFAQNLPTTICPPLGGDRADIVSVQSAYRANNGSDVTLTVPANVNKVLLTISSHSSVIPTPNAKENLGDENFLTASIVIDMIEETSSGILNYADSTAIPGTGTNLYTWINVPFGTFVSTQIALGQITPNLLNDIRITKSGNVLTVTESNTTLISSYLAEYTSSVTNSLLSISNGRMVFTGGVATRSLAIPNNTSLIVLSKKGTVRKSNYDSEGGTEEGYSDAKYIIDLDANRINGFNTLANGANIAFRSTYSVVNHTASDSTRFLSLPGANRIGDFSGKSSTSDATNDIGIENPRIYTNNGNLIISRNAEYRSDFDDIYLVEFLERTGLGMAVDFIETKSAFLPKGIIPPGQANGGSDSVVVSIPAGANFIFVRQAGNANNSGNRHNENALASYAVINLNTETANGYYWQQVGFTDQTTRRDDNYVYTNLPLDGTSSRNPTYSDGYYSKQFVTNQDSSFYDLTFLLSPDKSSITVRNKFGLVANTYQVITNLDFFGERPDFAFSTDINTDYKISNQGECGEVEVDITICNPGAGASPGGLPVSFYDKDPTIDASAILLFTGNFPEVIDQADCSSLPFDVDYEALSLDPNAIEFIAILNDNGSFVPGGVGNAVGNTFTLASLSTQTSDYKECDYDNNLITIPIQNIMDCPTANSLTTSNRSPDLTGSWDHVNATGLSVTVNNVTYVLGVDQALSVLNGTWTLSLSTANVILPNMDAIYPVTANSSNAQGFLIDQTTNELTILNPLSVGCVDFVGVNTNGMVALNWSTSTETNNFGFRIERSNSGSDFKEIGFVNGAGNSTITSNYNFIDRNANAGNNYYRLISIDYNQKESQECKIISVKVDAKATAVQIYPNPSNGIIYLNKGLEVINQIELMDVSGKVLLNQIGDLNEINFQNLAHGVYYLRIRTENGVSTHKVINQK